MNKMTKLRKRVQEIINDEDEDYRVSFLEDVCNHGCISGRVNELIYYNDTLAFYKLYRKDIQKLLTQYKLDSGITDVSNLLGNLFVNWDTEDPKALEQHNQNLLAWFGFEAEAHNILEEIENGNSR